VIDDILDYRDPYELQREDEGGLIDQRAKEVRYVIWWCDYIEAMTASSLINRKSSAHDFIRFSSPRLGNQDPVR
jgi:hypothetical protein